MKPTKNIKQCKTGSTNLANSSEMPLKASLKDIILSSLLEAEREEAEYSSARSPFAKDSGSKQYAMPSTSYWEPFLSNFRFSSQPKAVASPSLVSYLGYRLHHQTSLQMR